MTRSHLKVIGLTGGIATGKSTVAQFFCDQGIPVIDADQLARNAVLPGSAALDRIVAHFGSQVLMADGSLDRKQLAARIFAAPAERHILESILHPAIKLLAEEQIAAAAASGAHRVIYMAPLLIEAGATDRVDDIWVVTVSPEIQRDRLMQRDGISRSQAEQIIANQMPLAEKERYGSVVINNSGTADQTRAQLEAAWAKEMDS